MEYFSHERISEHIIRIKDICGTFLYLVEGKDRACLIDTGDGYGDLGSYIRQLTSKDVFVILTHGHMDHASGACFFKEIYMNPKDQIVYDLHTSIEYRDHNRPASVKDIPVSEMNPQYRGELLPLHDGDTFSLGDITLEAIEVSGHTPGMTCILIKEERTILFGDACGVFVLLYDEYSSCVSEYKKSLLHLKQYEDRYDRIIRNHGTGVSNKVLLDNVIELCDLVLEKKDDHIPIVFKEHPLFLAKKTDEENVRLDGKEGNLAYAVDKVC